MKKVLTKLGRQNTHMRAELEGPLLMQHILLVTWLVACCEMKMKFQEVALQVLQGGVQPYAKMLH